MRKPPPEEILNFEGPPGESVFRRAMVWCMNGPPEAELQARIDKTMDQVKALNEDRLLVLVGALLVENAVDELLAAIMPGYKSVRGNRDVTFAVRIELGRALQLCPSRFFANAHVVREVRNDFAHDLSVDTFAKLRPGRVQSMRDALSKFNVRDVAGKSDADVFKTFVVLLVLALQVYGIHVSRLNEFIRSKELFPVLRPFCEARGGRTIV